MTIDPDKFELLVQWYTRFNKYFSIRSFIVHAADDAKRVSKGVVGNYSEIDVFGIKMPFSKEISGELEIADDEKLIPLAEPKIDILIGECKTGDNALNKIWTKRNASAVAYLVKYAGIFQTEKAILAATEKLLETYSYEDSSARIRLILFSAKPDEPSAKGTRPLNITLDDILNFLLFIRGGCWMDHKIGERSIHYQWPHLINQLFAIGNDGNLPNEEKFQRALLLLEKNEQ